MEKGIGAYIDGDKEGGCGTGGGSVEDEKCAAAEKLDRVDAAFCGGEDRIALG